MSIRKKLIAALSLALFGVAAQAQSTEQIISNYGTILGSQKLEVGGLTAWTVEKNGQQLVLYTTEGDRKALIAGMVLDAKTGMSLSDTLSSLPVAPVANATVPDNTSAVDTSQIDTSQDTAFASEPFVSAMDGEFYGDMPDSMVTVDSLPGFKEGNGGIADTVYVIIDPRCPYCQKAYKLTRPYIDMGYTIKWIPTAALGDKDNGMPLAATILNSEDKSLVHKVLSGQSKSKTKLTDELINNLELNLAFMFAVFEQNEQKAGVPVAFYIDKRTQRPQMMTGLSEQEILNDIFGPL